MRRSSRWRAGPMAALMVVGVYVVIAVCAPLLANERPHFEISDNGAVRAALLGAMGPLDWCLLVMLGQCATLLWRRRDDDSGRVSIVWSVMMFGWALWPIAVWWMSGRDSLRAPLPACAAMMGVVLPIFALSGLARGLWMFARRGELAWWLSQRERGLTAAAVIIGVMAGMGAGVNAPRADVVAPVGNGAEHEGGWVLPALVAHDPSAADPNARALPPGRLTMRIWRTDAMGALRRCGEASVTDQGEVCVIVLIDEGILDETTDDPYRRPGRLIVITADGVRHVVPVPAGGEGGEGGDRYALARAIIDASGGAVGARRAGVDRIQLIDRTGVGRRHGLGTDEHGSDVCARLIHGARVSLAVGVFATLIAVLLGTALGLAMGACGGWIDGLGLRAIEIIQAVPRLFLLLIALAFIDPRHEALMLAVLIVMIGLTGWTNPARLVRGEIQRIRALPFVEAARAAGLGRGRVMWRHMLPHAVGPVWVDASFAVAGAMLLETSLSFLGFGVREPQASWGGMLAGAVDPAMGEVRWWLAAGPGVALCGLVLSLNIIGDAVRQSAGAQPTTTAGV